MRFFFFFFFFFLFKYDFDRSIFMHLKFEPTGYPIRDIQIIDSTFHVPQTLTLTAEPPGFSPDTKLLLSLF